MDGRRVRAEDIAQSSRNARWRRLKNQFADIELGRPVRNVEYFDSHHLIAFIKVNYNAWRHFLGFHDLRVVQPEIQRIGILVHV
jgi:hypothetical protein